MGSQRAIDGGVGGISGKGMLFSGQMQKSGVQPHGVGYGTGGEAFRMESSALDLWYSEIGEPGWEIDDNEELSVAVQY